jgi:6-phosphogluconolactonase
VAQYALAEDLRLTPLEPATVSAPAGSGPRHLVLNDAQDALYVLTEFSAEVLHFVRDTDAGTLELRSATPAFDPSKGLDHSRFGADPKAEHLIWGADLHLAAGGRWLWCSERTESTLGALRVSEDGSLSAPDLFTTAELQPRGFALTPDGAHLICAGERSTSVSLYAVEDDRLEPLQRAETGRGANWVRVI